MGRSNRLVARAEVEVRNGRRSAARDELVLIGQQTSRVAQAVSPASGPRLWAVGRLAVQEDPAFI
jgi:hypothetical protein